MTNQQTLQHFAAAAEPLQRAVTFKAWSIPDDGQRRAKAYGVVLPIEGPRYPANVTESYGRACSGRLCPAPGRRIDVSAAETLKEALDLAAPCCGHKGHLMILENDASRPVPRLHVYAIKQDGKPKYRGPFKTERYYEYYAAHLFDLDVGAFEPTPPANALRDPVGRDLTLVEQQP